MRMKIHFILLFLLGSMVGVNAEQLNTELVINGGGETGNTNGWISSGIDAVTPDSFSSGFGSFAFTGGTGDANKQTLLQTIDVSNSSAKIDASEIESIFSIQLQSRSAGNTLDQARVDVLFINNNNEQLGSFMFIDDVNTSSFDWNFFSDTRLIPVGTRSINILLTSTRTGGLSSDGFFDNVSLRLKDIKSCRAIYENGNLHIPCVDVIVNDPFSGSSTVSYKVNMGLIPNLEPLSFELKDASIIDE